MFSEREGRLARLVIYAVSLALGGTFSIVLLFAAWSSARAPAERDFSLESVALENTLSGNARAAHNAVASVAAFLVATPPFNPSQFGIVGRELLGQHPYLEKIAYCRALLLEPAGARCEDPMQVARAAGAAPAPAMDWSEVPGILNPEQAAEVFAASATGSGAHRQLWLLRWISESGTDQGTHGGLLAMLVNVDRLLEGGMRAAEITLVLNNDQANFGGRQVLLSRSPEAAAGQEVLVLSRDAAVQMPMYSLRLRVDRRLTWLDLQTWVVYVSALVGVGVTLLLVAFVRTKEVQARELAERNLVIERKVEEQTRELAQARDQALDASRVKSEFLAGMSHEIRTPLNAIIGMADLLAETPMSDEQKKYIDVFRKAGDTLLSLVNDILDFSKIEARQVRLEAIPFDVSDTVEEAVEIYALKAEGKGLELVADVEPGLNVNRVGDPARLRQILLNLLGNSIKFTEQGEVVVSIAREPSDPTGATIRFRVQDSGIGIPVVKRKLVFETFTQVDSSTTRKYGGTGLGLSICRSLVQLMGGDIWVEDGAAGRGSTFAFTTVLPPVHISAATTLPAPEQIAALRGRSVMLVEDNRFCREAVSRYLSVAGMQVMAVEGGAAAMARLPGSSGLDVILVDSSMPEANGIEFVAQLAGVRPGSKIMLLVGATDLNQHMTQIKELGIQGYVMKPIKRGELYRQLAGLFAQVETVRTGAETKVVVTPRRILLVDDNSDNRLLITSYLKKLPHVVVEVENGQRAVEEFQAQPFDLVFMDVQMPVLDGHEATRRIRAWERGEQRPPVPIIALTAHASKEEADRSLAAGCTTHMTKPVKKAALLQAIETYTS